MTRAITRVAFFLLRKPTFSVYHNWLDVFVDISIFLTRSWCVAARDGVAHQVPNFSEFSTNLPCWKTSLLCGTRPADLHERARPRPVAPETMTERRRARARLGPDSAQPRDKMRARRWRCARASSGTNNRPQDTTRTRRNPATGLEQRGSADDEEDHRVDEDRMW